MTNREFFVSISEGKLTEDCVAHATEALAKMDAANAKRKQMERFLAQIDGMTRADFFTGSIAVGPSLFLLEILYPRGKAIDCEPQQLARAAQLSIPERDKVARDFLQQGS